MNVKLIGALAVVAACAAAVLSWRAAPPSGSSEGTLTIEVRAPERARIAGVRYAITGQHELSGTLPASGPLHYAAQIAPLGAGRGYVVQVRTTDPSGADACTGSAEFDVTGGENTSVAVKLYCPPAVELAAAHGGGVARNVCPRVLSLSAVPSGSALLLTGLASDDDRGPSELRFQWSSEGADLSDSSEAAAMLACHTPGSYRVSLEVSDGACTDRLEQTVRCTEGLAKLGEQGAAREAHADERADNTETTIGSALKAREPGALVGAAGAASPTRPGSAAAVIGASASAAPGEGVPAPSEAAASSRASAAANSSSKGSADTVPGTKLPEAKPADPCAKCESLAHEDNFNCPQSTARCDNLPGLTDPNSPYMPNTPRGTLCRQIVDCIHRTHCAAINAEGVSTPTDCFCGAGVEPDACFNHGNFGQARGPCKELIAAGSESMDVAEIAMRFFDATYAAGAAEALVETCDVFFCRECL